ncbi:MAG TPA: DUF2911 domain-containing protein [Candidatus Binatia bacterium]|jgi:hypothetical protein|nr:DUF2911 domain-containing protein [Candidatus Binatia bacterium]
MKRNISKLILFTAVVAGACSLQAGVSPHETISATIDGSKITLTYGRPFSKKPGTTEVRKIWGGLVPYGKVWRTGADAATVLNIEQPLAIGETTVPAGKYTLFTFPVEDGTSKLIINKRTGQWGIPYDEKKEADNELARVDMKKETLDKDVDQFTMAIEPNPSGGGVLKMMWEKTQYSVPFTVKK